MDKSSKMDKIDNVAFYVVSVIAGIAIALQLVALVGQIFFS